MRSGAWRRTVKVKRKKNRMRRSPRFELLAGAAFRASDKSQAENSFTLPRNGHSYTHTRRLSYKPIIELILRIIATSA